MNVDTLQNPATETPRGGDVLFQQIVDSIPVPVAVTTPAGDVEGVNRQTLQYFGKSFDELRGWKASDAVHPEDLARTIAAQIAAHKSGDSYNVESRHRRADGVYRWFSVRGFPLRDEQGNILRWFHLLNDIDDRKRAEEAVRASQHDLNQIVNTIPALVWSARPDGSAEFFNPHYLRYVGMSAEEARDLGWAAAVHPGDLHGLIDSWKRMLTSEQAGEAEARLRRFDGVYRWFLFRANPLRNESGAIVKWYGINIDIHDRKQSEDRLQQSEARKAAMFEAALSCIVMIDQEGVITEFNPSAEITFGYRQENVVGKRIDEVIISPPCRLRYPAGFARHLASGTSELLGKRVETIAMRSDGSVIPIELAITRIGLEGPISFALFLRDITDRHKWVEERNWAESLLAGEKKLLEMIASDRPLSEVLTALCTFVEKSTDCFCGFYPIDWSGPAFRGAVAPSLPETYWRPIEGLPVRCDAAPCGIAVLEKRQVIVEDVHTDPMWRGTSYGAHVLKHGLTSVWSTPIISREGRVLGTFCIYQGKAGKPSERIGELTAQIAHIASIAMEGAQVEAAFRRSEALLAEGQRLSQTGTFSWCVETDEMVWSEESYRIMGVDRTTRLTLDLVMATVHPEDAPAFQTHVEQARLNAAAIELECRLLLPDGSIKHVQVRGHGSRNRNGHLEYIGAIQDITQRRLADDALSKARSELARVARMTSLNALTASIAHEVNQPLSGIITNASTCLRLLSSDPPNVNGAIETAKRTIRDGHRAADVITRLRTLFTRKEGMSEPVDLNETAREVIALMLSELQRNRIILRTEFAESLPLINGDRVQLQQVILNLLQNATDAMTDIDDRPRELLIRTSLHDGSQACVSVRDSGMGIDPHAMNRMFDAFYTTKMHGMGIGLSVSRSIIENHHGRMYATSNEGPGATFSFTLPCQTDSVADAARIGVTIRPKAAPTSFSSRNL